MTLWVPIEKVAHGIQVLWLEDSLTNPTKFLLSRLLWLVFPTEDSFLRWVVVSLSSDRTMLSWVTVLEVKLCQVISGWFFSRVTLICHVVHVLNDRWTLVLDGSWWQRSCHSLGTLVRWRSFGRHLLFHHHLFGSLFRPSISNLFFKMLSIFLKIHSFSQFRFVLWSYLLGPIIFHLFQVFQILRNILHLLILLCWLW